MNWVRILIAVGVMVLIGVLMALILAFANHKLKVEVDERVGEVTKMLPGVNCGGCGYAGCAAFAEALIAGKQPKVSGCIVAKLADHEKIVEYINQTPGPDGEVTKVVV